MKDPASNPIELTGTSTTSVEDAVDQAMKRGLGMPRVGTR